jgi:hypothetical protein
MMLHEIMVHNALTGHCMHWLQVLVVLILPVGGSANNNLCHKRRFNEKCFSLLDVMTRLEVCKAELLI